MNRLYNDQRNPSHVIKSERIKSAVVRALTTQFWLSLMQTNHDIMCI